MRHNCVSGCSLLAALACIVERATPAHYCLHGHGVATTECAQHCNTQQGRRRPTIQLCCAPPSMLRIAMLSARRGRRTVATQTTMRRSN
eukprot:11169666-Lingulodinium_polyedra.AAC.1